MGTENADRAAAPLCARLAGLPLIAIGLMNAAAFIPVPSVYERPTSGVWMLIAWTLLTLAGGIGVALSYAWGWALAVVATALLILGMGWAYVAAGGDAGFSSLVVIFVSGGVAMLAALVWPTTVRWAFQRMGRDKAPG